MARGWFGSKEAHSKAAKEGWQYRKAKAKKAKGERLTSSEEFAIFRHNRIASQQEAAKYRKQQNKLQERRTAAYTKRENERMRRLEAGIKAKYG